MVQRWNAFVSEGVLNLVHFPLFGLPFKLFKKKKTTRKNETCIKSK